MNEVDKKMKKMKIIIAVLSVVVVISVISITYFYISNSSNKSEKVVSNNKKEDKESKKTSESSSSSSDSKETEELKLSYYEDVTDYINELEYKNSSISVDNIETEVNKKFGKNTYKLYTLGYLISRHSTPSDIEQITLKARNFLDNNIVIGYTYKNIEFRPNGDFIDEDRKYNVVNGEVIFLPTTDGFIDVGNGTHVGYPTLSYHNEDGTKYTVLRALVYFDEDVPLTELGKKQFNLSLNGYESKNIDSLPKENLDEIKKEYGDGELVEGLGNYGFMIFDSLFGNSSDYFKDGGYKGKTLAKNGIISYTVVVDIDENSVKSLKPEQKVTIGNTTTEIKQYVGMSLEDDISLKVRK